MSALACKCRHIVSSLHECNLNKASLHAAGVGAFFRPRDILPLGVSFRQLQAAGRQGTVEKLGGGVYRLSEVEPTELETIAMVASAVPDAIVCLLTALRVHEIGTQSPHEVWLALDRKGRKPDAAPGQGPHRPLFRSHADLRRESPVHAGVPVAITSPARTVVDCFRYRNKVGLDVAMEALRDCGALAQGHGGRDIDGRRRSADHGP